jgi:hypothetical protein
MPLIVMIEDLVTKAKGGSVNVQENPSVVDGGTAKLIAGHREMEGAHQKAMSG